MDPTSARIIGVLGLEPLPVEGGLFRQTWRAVDGDRVVGTAIYAAYTDDADSFSAMHRLSHDEIWHFYAGDPIKLLLLHADGGWGVSVLGPDVLAGQRPQVVVSAGTWMGGRLVAGGSFGLFGTTMAPGFDSSCYEGATATELLARWPDAADRILRLVRDGGELAMPPGL